MAALDEHRRRQGMTQRVDLDEGCVSRSKQATQSTLQSSRCCSTITRLEACSRSTSHRHLDSSVLLGHENTGDRCSGAGREHALATNRNNKMLRLNASHHDD